MLDASSLRERLTLAQSEIIAAIYEMDDKQARVDWTDVNNRIAGAVKQIQFIESGADL